MKELILIRHAKSSWNNVDLPDIERPLNKRGKSDAPVMAQELLDNGGGGFDLLISSSAKRAYDTAKAFSKTIGYPKKKIEIIPSIYHSSPEELLELVQQIDKKHSRVALIGHNPSISWLLSILCDTEVDTMPTCAVAVIKFETDSWKEAKQGVLAFYQTPKSI